LHDAKDLGDVGDSDPQNWEKPFRTSDVHVILVAVSPDEEHLEAAVARARETYQSMTGIEAIMASKTVTCYQTRKNHSVIAMESVIPRSKAAGFRERIHAKCLLKPVSFVIGYTDELGGVQKTTPEILGRNGTYVVFRKLHQRVADFRKFLKTNSSKWTMRSCLRRR